MGGPKLVLAQFAGWRIFRDSPLRLSLEVNGQDGRASVLLWQSVCPERQKSFERNHASVGNGITAGIVRIGGEEKSR